MDYLPNFVVEGGGGTITFVPRQPIVGVKVGAREKTIDTDIDELLNSFKTTEITGGNESDDSEEDLTEKVDDNDEPMEDPVELSEPVEPE
jgi:hypothetical protein